MAEKMLMKPEDEAILMWVVMPRNKYEDVKLPEGCYAKTVLMGPAGDLQHKMVAAHWGITVGKSIHNLGLKIVAHLPKLTVINPLDV